jgi:hypothetical protein
VVGTFEVSKPTLFLAGEAGPEMASFSGANQLSPAGDDTSDTSNLGDKFDELLVALKDLVPAIRIGIRDLVQRTI